MFELESERRKRLGLAGEKPEEVPKVQQAPILTPVKPVEGLLAFRAWYDKDGTWIPIIIMAKTETIAREDCQKEGYRFEGIIRDFQFRNKN